MCGRRCALVAYPAGGTMIELCPFTKSICMKHFLAMLMIVLGSKCAVAQTPHFLSEIEYVTQYDKGQLVDCVMEFTVLFPTRASDQSQMSGMHGWMTWIVNDDHDMIALLRLFSMDFLDGPTGKPVPFAIDHVSVQIDKMAVPPNEIPCAKDETFCGAMIVEGWGLKEFALTGKPPVSLSFRRTAKDQTYNLMLEGKADPRQDAKKFATEFAEQKKCMAELQKQADAR